MKTCTRCHVEKPVGDFPKDRQWTKNFCKKCDNARRNTLYHSDPESVRWKRIEHQYGVSREQWEACFESQGRRCGCCGSTDPGKGRNWQTEHDHKTKVFRGITCLSCNVMLGAARDSVDKLRAGIEYLQRASQC